MQSTQLVQLESPGEGVRLLTLNDPGRLNALGEAMGQAIAATARELAGDATLRVLVLTGAGRAFSSGGDLKMLDAMSRAGRASPGGETRAQQHAAMLRFYRLFLSLGELPVPTIAAINGAAIGAGFCLALNCDLRIVARDATLALNFARLGIHPGMAASWIAPRLAGPAHAAELLYSGRRISGEEAARIGLANRALPGEQVLESALETAAAIAAAGPAAVRATKRSLRESATATLDAQLDREAREQAIAYESADLAEGLAALREKRAPEFSGN